MKSPHILLIDQAQDSEPLTDHLPASGYTVERVNNGVEGVIRALSGAHALALLSTGRTVTGIEYLRRIRRHSLLPVLLLASGASDAERILALETGADDYLQKPYNPHELCARIHAVLRRTGFGISLFSHFYRVDDIELDKLRRIVTRNGEQIVLTSVEFDLLAVLLRSVGRVVTREELARATLGREWRVTDRSIDVHISNLRRKLGRGNGPVERIVTIRGIGYLYSFAPDAVNQS